MKIIADQRIPYVDDLFNQDFQLELVSDQAITTKTLSDATILICRSTLKVNQALLAQSAIEVVASPTSGCDHFDTNYLQQKNIVWYHKPGCNAQAVVEYVMSSVAYLQQQGILNTNPSRAAVIGAGHVGQAVIDQLTDLGYEVLVYDPPRAQREPGFQSVALEEIADVDLICLHPLLIHDAPYPSYHLIDKTFLQRQQQGTILLNASRGAVVNSQDLLNYGKHLHWCFDVYENEPIINADIVNQSVIATPHIAGHSIEAKWRGIYSVYQKICQHYGIPIRHNEKFPGPMSNKQLERTDDWRQNSLLVYDPMIDSQTLKKQPESFRQLRNDYRYRYECATLLS